MRFFDSGRRSNELVHPIRIEKDDNDNYIYSKKVSRSSLRSDDYEPKWTKVDVRDYSPDFSSPYIRSYERRAFSPPRERIIPLRTVYSEMKPPAFSSYRSLNRSSNLRSNIRNDFPEFSSLNSPSKISTLRR